MSACPNGHEHRGCAGAARSRKAHSGSSRAPQAGDPAKAKRCSPSPQLQAQPVRRAASRHMIYASLTVLAILLAGVPCAAGQGPLPLKPPTHALLNPARTARCLFSFQQGMPPGVFCVYDGVATGPAGTCGRRVMVIWTRLAPEFTDEGSLGEDVFGSSDVYFGFVMLPELVMRAIPETDAGGGATLVDYSMGGNQPRVLLHGTAELRLRGSGGESTEVLGLRWLEPVLAGESCAFTAYDGTFIGTMTLPFVK